MKNSAASSADKVATSGGGQGQADDGARSHVERLQTTTEAAGELLHHASVDRWEVFAKASFTREIAVTGRTTPHVIHVEETGVAARTVRNHRCGFAAASGLETDAARRAVEGSLGTETPSPIDPLPPHRLLGASSTGPPRRLPPQGWAPHAMEELAAAVPGTTGGRLELHRCVLQEGAFAWILATGDGFVATFEDARLALMAEVVIGAEPHGVWREWLHIPDPEAFDAESVARQVVNRAMLTGGAVVSRSGTHDILLHPEVSAHLLAALVHLFVPAPPSRDRLPALLDRDGRLAAPSLSVVDVRNDPGAPITAPCDGEGLPASRTLLLDHGVPRHRLTSFRDAMLWDDTPRGGAVRLSYRDYPASGITNLRVETDGGVPPARLLAALGDGLYLLRPLAPLSLDPRGTSFRLVACGVWLTDGKLCGWQPVVELSGDLGGLLRAITVVGTDLQWCQTPPGFVGAPSILISDQTITG